MPIVDVIDLFLHQGEAGPRHPAVVENGVATSYADLVALAHRFVNAFAPVERPRVLIALPQGAAAYAAMFAAGMAGGYYVPVNVAAPLAKIRRMAQIVQPNVIVAEDAERGAEIARAVPGARCVTPGDTRTLSAAVNLRDRHEIAYVMFTSGSTGDPKGVVIPRTALNRHAAWLTHDLALGPNDRVAQHPNIAFDLSVFSIYGSLCTGATAYPVVGTGDRLRPARFVQREKLTVWISVPSVISLMIQARDVTAARLGSLRLFTFCGEPLLREHLDAIFAACPNAVVQNTYGPTEATVSMTSLHLTGENYLAACATSVALGDPIEGSDMHLVGGATSDEGEIVITGDQLALGYFNDPVRTAEKFKSVSVNGDEVRGYYTGDWAERRHGQLFFKERLDFQVKVHGHRVELDEVAATIRSCGWPVVCVFKNGAALAAVVEKRPDIVFDEAGLRTMLTTKIEEFAVPVLIREIESMPRNANDKIERSAAIAWFLAT